MKRLDILTVLALSSCLLLGLDSVVAHEVDTTRVREVTKVRKSTGEIIADIPGEIVKFPLRVVQFTAHTITHHNSPTGWAFSLIDFGAEAKPYVPIVGFGNRSGLKLGFGLRKLKNLQPGDEAKFKWYYSTNDYQSYKLQYRMQQLFSNRLGLQVYFRYKKRPRESFYGVGMTSREDKEASYTLENTEFRTDFPFRMPSNMTLALSGGYHASNLTDGRDPDLQGNLDTIFADPDFGLDPGRLDGSRYITIGGYFSYDGRDHRGQPSKGQLIKLDFLRYIGTDRSDGEDFYKASLDVSQYLNIWKKRIIAARVFVQRFDSDNDNLRARPIHMTSTLGGAEGLRGYSRGRFIDNDFAVASIEYRYPVWTIVDWFLFFEEGRVFRSLTDEPFFFDWRYSAGTGFRIWNIDDVTMMVLFAVSEESSRFYLEFGANW